MTHINSPRLSELIERFYEIGRTKYNGHVYDNVLNIFKELDIEDQKTLLRGSLGLYTSVMSDLVVERDVIDQGDYGALLIHLKRKTNETKNELLGLNAQTNTQDTVVDSNQERDLIKTVKTIMVITALFISSHIVYLAISDSDVALEVAKVYVGILTPFMN